ncbi:Crp/Fnr family transcriptional regulator [Maribacter sp. R77961]|uniref:Crp/Fnr family transcriptional regulator n=1 Tax=Maribacter sp. R77961 TaxID=3093871 RepID=UPI0037C9942A
MDIKEQALSTYFPELAKMPKLRQELVEISSIVDFEAGTVILRQGEYIKVIPLLLSGFAKVFKEEAVHGNEVLLYYIKPGESCVMSMTTLIRNGKSQVKAVIEEDAKVLILPAIEAMAIAKTYPQWNEFVYDLFQTKFEELLQVIETLTFSNKDVRLLEYLKKESVLKESKVLNTTHQHIANDLGSSREVISRLLKKLEHEGQIGLKQGEIQILN